MNQNEMTIGKVRLNLEYYKGEDLYSDGDIEDEILEIVKRSEVYDKAIADSDRFEVFYHLSKEREMIARIMDITKKDKVLEIGAGCGAVTGALAEMAGSVECVELSKRRSLINAYRHKDCDNIQIDIGNYEDIPFNKKYSVITLIGVLEYAGYYIHSQEPYKDFLADVRSKMTDGGLLYIAIENRLGMKYFAGCKEDHLGKEFAGIEGYEARDGVRTFSYYELIELFKSVGFSEYEFYYPYPDYKFPHAIYSDAYLPQSGCFVEKGTNYTSSRKQIFDETRAFDSLVMKDEFKIFSNSFLVALRK
ncbi:MAG: class I SAM-dependent methyltransferase [Lachnospiraceae bacterium]|nr:class I SAM-dependent methyltransferase [Lachnospiraceae bacterium]